MDVLYDHKHVLSARTEYLLFLVTGLILHFPITLFPGHGYTFRFSCPCHLMKILGGLHQRRRNIRIKKDERMTRSKSNHQPAIKRRISRTLWRKQEKRWGKNRNFTVLIYVSQFHKHIRYAGEGRF